MLQPTLYYVFYEHGHYDTCCGVFDTYELADDHIKAFVRRNEAPKICLGEGDFYIKGYTLNYWLLEDLEDGNV